jgi:3-deoxy-D-manno-octulosonic acid (KDO) 8-phosphate synthase
MSPIKLKSTVRTFFQIAQKSFQTWDMNNVVPKIAATGNERILLAERTAVRVDCVAVFMETRQDPDNVPSEMPNMLPVDALAGLLVTFR